MRGAFQMSDGTALSVITDDEAEGERVVLGKTEHGELVRYQIQSTSVTASDREAMQQELLDVSDAITGTGYREIASAPETFRVEAPALDSDLTWTPVSVIATTSDTAATARSESSFSATIPGVIESVTRDGEVLIRDLDSDSTYSAILEASVDMAGGDQLERQRVVEIQTLGSEGAVSHSPTRTTRPPTFTRLSSRMPRCPHSIAGTGPRTASVATGAPTSFQALPPPMTRQITGQ